jgi:hypothetical protein
VAEAFEQLRLAVEGDSGIDEGAEVEVRRDPVLAHHGRASREQGCLRGISANRGDDREPVERLMKGNA